MAELKIAKPATDAEKKTQTTTDTWEFTATTAKTWRSPSFQRPLRVNEKVTTAATEIKESGGVIPGTFTIGVFEGDRWLVDGQHRREAFSDEFVKVNSRLVNLKPDDIVRGMEASCESIAKLKKKCAFVGYDNVRRNERSPVIAMSQLLRCWNRSANDTPRTGGVSAAQLAEQFTTEDCDQLANFLDCTYTAWGRDPQNYRLWSSLNLTLCMWVYRRIHLTAYSAKTQRVDKELFTKCLMSVSAAELYVAWLMGRGLNTRDLAPAYARLKGLFSGRIESETGKKAYMPAPTWSSHR